VLPLAQALAQDLGSSLLLVHAVSSPWAGEPGTFVPTLHDRTLRESVDAAKHMIDRVANGIEKTNALTVTRTVHIGDAVQQIVGVAEAESVGLIAMSTHGRTGVGRWMIGSVADAVVRRAHAPSLLVRPRVASGE
jgi:nucleotide-binding universal stress UspA family protein